MAVTDYTKEEFEKSQEEFRRKISTNGTDLGIQDELINMRLIKYISGGKEGVENFENKLMASFGDYQSFLMSDDRRTFNFDLLMKAKRMYETLCQLENATDNHAAISITSLRSGLHEEITKCLAEVKMENVI